MAYAAALWAYAGGDARRLVGFNEYDGQWSYWLARDPGLAWCGPLLDNAPYRAGRILAPALAHAIPLGAEWSVLLVNLAGLALGLWAASRILAHLGLSPAELLAAAANPGYALGLLHDTVEPVQLGAATWALAWRIEGRHGRCATALALAGLARESALLVALAFAIEAAWWRRWRRAALYAAAALPYLAWCAYVRVQLGALPVAAGGGGLGFAPAAIPWAELWRGLLVPGLAGPAALLAVASVAALALALLALVEGARRRGGWGLVLALQGAMVLSLGRMSWDAAGSAARIACLLVLLLLALSWQDRAARRAGA